MAQGQSQTTSQPVLHLAQSAAVEALNGPRTSSPNDREVQQRRDLVVSMLNQAKGIRCPKPEGVSTLPVLRGPARQDPRWRQEDRPTDEDFVTANCLRTEGVAAVIGAAFGLSPFFRISYAMANEDQKTPASASSASAAI